MNVFMINSNPFPVINISVQAALRRRSRASSNIDIEVLFSFSSTLVSELYSTRGGGMAEPARGGA